jgi:hypothetical protein
VDHELTAAARAEWDHFERFFPRSWPTLLAPAPGPVRKTVPDLHILSLTPPGGGWLYATNGLWDATHHEGHALEFVLHAPAYDDLHTETLTMVAFYHASGGDFALDVGHTVPLGRPWRPGSSCDHLLVSRPYPWGPELELCKVPGGHARILWLLPITEAEKTYRHTHGLEALEQLFDSAAIDPIDPERRSVVPG